MRQVVLLFVSVDAGSTVVEASVISIEAIGITGKKMRAATDFCTRILRFESAAEKEVSGAEFERLFGVFDMPARTISDTGRFACATIRWNR